MEPIKFVTVLTLLLFSACTSTQFDVPDIWQSELHVDHALVGTIWDSRRDQFIEVEELVILLEGTRYLLLGEKHDNPDHHALQLAVLDYVIEQQDVSSVSFEMMSSNQQPLLDSLNTQQLNSLDEINAHLNWDNDGWDWSYYEPFLSAALAAGIDISAANISQEKMMQVYAETTSEETANILNQQTMAALEKDIDESHCGLLPEAQFPAMVRVQQARDLAMAASFPVDVSPGMQILIAGNYHIRHDLGVPNYLLNRQTDLRKEQIAALAFMEVDASTNEPSEYLQQFSDVKAYDFIWFTPAISDEDYCASLQQPELLGSGKLLGSE